MTCNFDVHYTKACSVRFRFLIYIWLDILMLVISAPAILMSVFLVLDILSDLTELHGVFRRCKLSDQFGEYPCSCTFFHDIPSRA